jgi:hypothetical protein
LNRCLFLTLTKYLNIYNYTYADAPAAGMTVLVMYSALAGPFRDTTDPPSMAQVTTASLYDDVCS